MSGPVRIGTRGSALALAQATWLRDALAERRPDRGAALVVIKTSGDRFVDRPLGDIGGKGLFVKEIDEALSAGTVDCAVHSMKDLPASLAPGLHLAAVPRRVDARDLLLTRHGGPLAALPPGARIGTSSLRRAALLLHLRPDIAIVPLRGNVDTRLRKLAAGEFDAIVLAAAGLHRLGLTPPAATPLDPTVFVPAVGQGALALETRDDGSADLLAWLDDPMTRVAVSAERAFMATVGGSCHTPLAAHATVRAGDLHLQAFVASPDGSRLLRGERAGPLARATPLGHELANDLLDRGAADILRLTRPSPAAAAAEDPSTDGR
ncbi:hydroxymethylbilane synthase [Candidatus Binatia bacterium]|nr:hydroxymethylbilane synthase [Candidatus Binatia bacterium]